MDTNETAKHKDQLIFPDPLTNTFPTEVEFAIDDLPTSFKEEGSSATVPKLPTAVNFVALRESLLSEAPFVSSKNKNFWRRCVNSRFFQNILSSSFHLFSDCINDEGTLNVEKIYSSVTEKSLLASLMATNLAEMFFCIKLRDRDVFLSRLPEVLGFMVVNALLTSIPKYHRLFNSIKFREIILDWYSELLSGVRFTNNHTDKEWYFVDAVDTPESVILVNTKGSSNNNPDESAFSNSMNSNDLKNSLTSTSFNNNDLWPTKKSERSPVDDDIAFSKVSLELSPLIDMYISSSMKRVPHPLSLTLSQLPSRPLTTLNDSLSGYHRIRKKRINMQMVHDISKGSNERRSDIMTNFRLHQEENERQLQTLRSQLNKELHKISDECNESLEVSKRESKVKKDEWRQRMKEMNEQVTGGSPGSRKISAATLKKFSRKSK